MGFYNNFGTQFNRHTNLDNLEYRVFSYLAKNQGKYADNLFKVLKYNTPDALQKDSVSFDDRMGLLYKTNGDASDENVFLQPYVDDAIENQCSQMYIYVYKVLPETHLASKVIIGVDLLTHNKISNVYGDASLDNCCTNPSEIDKNGEPTIIYKNRATVMLKSIIGALNGESVYGVGQLQFNQQNSDQDYAVYNKFNGRKFYGYTVYFSTIVSGMSNDTERGR